MGFLDLSTSNILIDACLTDLGRASLAKNDGSFSIVKFAVSDEEIDYTIIKKFGRTVGKEKIEKNTPVFEALTNGAQAQKYRMITVSNPNLIRLPSLSLTGEGVDSTATVVSMTSSGAGKSRRITLTQAISNENSIDVELRDQAFVVKMNNIFMQIPSSTPDNVDQNSIATYVITRDASTTATGGSIMTLDLSVKTLTDTLFTVYGSSTNKNLISTVVSVSGIQSGAVKEFQCQITKST